METRDQKIRAAALKYVRERDVPPGVPKACDEQIVRAFIAGTACAESLTNFVQNLRERINADFHAAESAWKCKGGFEYLGAMDALSKLDNWLDQQLPEKQSGDGKV